MLKRVFGFAAVLFLCFFSSACFSIEREIFLNADGSGDMVIHVSLPDFPDEAKKASKETPLSTQLFSAGDIEKFKKEMMSKLPPTVTLKDSKFSQQNGMVSFYAIFAFKDIKDIKDALTDFGMDETSTSKKPEWQLNFQKVGDKTSYSESFSYDVSSLLNQKSGQVEASPPTTPSSSTTPPPASAKARSGQTTKENPPVKLPTVKMVEGAQDDQFKGLDNLLPLLLGAVRMRFVLHTPTPISDSNADIILNRRTAIWNCSPIKFVKDKKPIELKAVF